MLILLYRNITNLQLHVRILGNSYLTNHEGFDLGYSLRKNPNLSPEGVVNLARVKRSGNNRVQSQDFENESTGLIFFT